MGDISKITEEMCAMESWSLDLTGIFGNTAEVTQTPENEYEVKVTLENGITSGGQEVLLRLTKVQETGFEPPNDTGYLCKDFVVNNINLTKIDGMPRIYFVPRWERNRVTSIFEEDPSVPNDWDVIEILSQNSSDATLLHTNLQKGTFADISKGEYRVVMRVFTLSDDIAVLMHEYGHALGGENQKKADNSEFSALVANLEKGKIKEITDEHLEIWKTALFAEVEANNRMYRLLRQRGELFPQETNGLPGVREFISRQLDPYIKAFGGKFAERLGQEKLNRLITIGDFETD